MREFSPVVIACYQYNYSDFTAGKTQLRYCEKSTELNILVFGFMVSNPFYKLSLHDLATVSNFMTHRFLNPIPTGLFRQLYSWGGSF